MRSFRSLVTSLIASVLALAGANLAYGQTSHDIVVYGGNAAGVVAAVKAARAGKSVVVIEPSQHLGGLSAGGLGWTDSGDKGAIGGISREFYQRVRKHYETPEAWRQQKPAEYSHFRPGEDAIWNFEPHVAEKVLKEMVAEAKVPVVFGQRLDLRPGVGVKKDGPRILSIVMESGQSYAGKVFIDCSYEGDLMAKAGVEYTVGREANSQYGETLNGVQISRARSHQFDHPVDPYVKPGDPLSGLLPGVHGGDPGKEGDGDKRVQAYNFRVCLTNVPENRVPFPKPADYNPQHYELLARYVEKGWRGMFGKFDPIPNRKTDTNNHGGFSTDNIGMNYDYPDGDYATRERIIKEHVSYQKGYFWFLANDERVPAEVRTKMSQWGLAKDEFTDHGNWPHQIYVREARRMVAEFVMTENHLTRKKPTPQPIGMGSYNMDSHNTQRYVDAKGLARNEGDIQVSPGGPYPVSYLAVTPKEAQASNLLSPVCLSSTHIAYGSIRMEPVFMILGHSSAAAAIIAIDDGVSVQKVDYEKLKKVLLAEGQVLEYERKGKPGGGGGGKAGKIDAASLKGVVVDDSQAKATGEWTHGAAIGPFVGEGYHHNGGKVTAGSAAKTLRYEATLPQAGNYEIRVSYSANANRAGNALCRVETADGPIEKRVDQRKPAPIDGAWISLGVHKLPAKAGVTLSDEGADGHVIADAVWFVPQ